MTHRNDIAKTGAVLLAALVSGLLGGCAGRASTNAVEQMLTDTNLAAAVAADYEKYKQGQIDKGQMMQSIWDANNHSRQDLYGKVIDQDGHPVAGVDVTGIIIMIGEQILDTRPERTRKGCFSLQACMAAT